MKKKLYCLIVAAFLVFGSVTAAQKLWPKEAQDMEQIARMTGYIADRAVKAEEIAAQILLAQGNPRDPEWHFVLTLDSLERLLRDVQFQVQKYERGAALKPEPPSTDTSVKGGMNHAKARLDGNDGD